jgi:phage FluMu protein Com
MTYQKCPICDGIGMVPEPYAVTTSFHVKCPTCKGARIISSMTGLPPEMVVKEVEEREKDEQFKKELQLIINQQL